MKESVKENTDSTNALKKNAVGFVQLKKWSNSLAALVKNQKAMRMEQKLDRELSELFLSGKDLLTPDFSILDYGDPAIPHPLISLMEHTAPPPAPNLSNDLHRLALSSNIVKLPEMTRSLRPFYQHQWLDVCDSENHWLEASIVKIENDFIHIHYKGWRDKYDEKIPMSEAMNPKSIVSQRLAPYLSKFTEPPTFGTLVISNGLRLDIQDTTEKWIEGEIREIKQVRDGSMCRVRYRNWDPKYDGRNRLNLFFCDDDDVSDF
jgi:hypothetical protein